MSTGPAEDGTSTKDGASSERGDQRSPEPFAAAASNGVQQAPAMQAFGTAKDNFYSSDSDEDTKSRAASQTAPARPHFKVIPALSCVTAQGVLVHDKDGSITSRHVQRKSRLHFVLSDEE